MHKISKEQFLDKKKSDTLIIWGCGYSINDLTDKEKKKLSQFDGLSYNWFCKAHIPTTFYIVREQITGQGYKGETGEHLTKDLNKHNKNTCIIIVDMIKSGGIWKGRRGWTSYHQRFQSQDGVMLKEKYYEYKYKKIDSKSEGVYSDPKTKLFCECLKRYDIFDKALLYYSCTMSNAIHIGTWLKYKRILFVGVDLYDHRYFWLPPDKLREITRRKRRKLNDKHKTYDFTSSLVKMYPKICPEIELYSYNPKSLLAKYIPIWER